MIAVLHLDSTVILTRGVSPLSGCKFGRIADRDCWYIFFWFHSFSFATIIAHNERLSTGGGVIGSPKIVDNFITP